MEFVSVQMEVKTRKPPRVVCTHLLLPALQLLDEIVVALGNLAELGIHAALEVNKVLPGLESITRVLVALADNLVEVAHGDLGHQRLLDGATEDGLETSVATHLLTDMVHHRHDGILVPPLRILNRLDLTAHDDDLAGGNELTTAVGGSKMLRNTGGRDIAVERLSEAGDKLVALANSQGGGRARSENEVAVQVDNKRVGGSGEQRPALRSDTKDVRTGLLNELLGVTGVDDRDVEAAPLVDANAESDGLSSHRQHGGVVADEDDSASGRDSGLDDAHNVGDRQTAEERPHGEVLEARGRRRELIAQSIVLHVDADQVVESWSGETEDARHLLSVEQVSGLVPVDPHASKVIAKEVVEGVSRKERQAVGDPVGLVGVVVKVRLRTSSEITNRLSSLLVGARPDAKADTVKGVRRVLLEDEGMVNAVRLATTSANLDIVREASL